MRNRTQILTLLFLMIISCTKDDTVQIDQDIPLSTFENTANPHVFQQMDNRIFPVFLNKGGPQFPGRLHLEHDLTIGQDRGPDEYILDYISQVEVDTKGNIFIVDSGHQAILIYDSNGQFLAKSGREGNGPGEFRRVPTIQIYSDGTMDTFAEQGRYARWSKEHFLDYDRRIPFLSEVFGSRLLTTFNEENIYEVINPWYGGRIDTSTAWWIVHRNPVTGGQIGVTRFPRGRPTYLQETYKGDRLGSSMPFATDLMVRQHPDGKFYIADCDSSKFHVFDTNYNQILEVRWEAHRELLDKDTYQAAFDWMTDPEITGRQNEMGREVTEWRQTIPRASTKPIIASMVVAVDGHVWVEHWGEGAWADRIPTFASEPDGMFDYWVFSAHGELKYQTTLPFRVDAADAEYIYERIVDRESTPQVRRWRWLPPAL